MNETYKNVLITGGCGRLGRQCYYELHNEYNITLFDRVAPSKQPFPWTPEKDCKFVMGELTSLEDCMRAILMSKADCILHLAAITHATEVGRRVFQMDLGEDTYYVRDLLGLSVYSNGELLGELIDWFPTGSNDVYVVRTPEGKNVMVPAIKQVVKKVDLENKKMEVELLEGLIDED